MMCVFKAVANYDSLRNLAQSVLIHKAVSEHPITETLFDLLSHQISAVETQTKGPQKSTSKAPIPSQRCLVQPWHRMVPITMCSIQGSFATRQLVRCV